MKNMRIKIAGLALAGVLALSGCGSNGGTYATVNGEAISKEKYDSQLNLYKSMLAAQYQLPQSIKNSLIQEQVMLQDLKKNEVTIDEKEYAVEYDKAVQAYGGAANYGNTLKQIGITDEQLKDSLRYETISRIHKDWYNKKNVPTDQEIKDYFDKNKDSLLTVDASHILVATEEEAKAVKTRLEGGEKFEDVAKEVSTDTGSAQKGGELGEAAPSTYVAEFAEALNQLKPGEVSDPVKTQFGYHIIRLNKKNDTLESVKDKIVEQLNASKYNEYIQSLVSSADVKVEGESSSSESSEGAADDSAQESSASADSSAAESSSK